MYGPEFCESIASLHRIGRAGEISDVIDGIPYLERATFVTGETLHIDGGEAAGHCEPAVRLCRLCRICRVFAP